jgi:hypothetical protein
VLEVRKYTIQNGSIKNAQQSLFFESHFANQTAVLGSGAAQYSTTHGHGVAMRPTHHVFEHW